MPALERIKIAGQSESVFLVKIVRLIILQRIGLQRDILVGIEVDPALHLFDQAGADPVDAVLGFDADGEDLDIAHLALMRIGHRKRGEHLEKNGRLLEERKEGIPHKLEEVSPQHMAVRSCRIVGVSHKADGLIAVESDQQIGLRVGRKGFVQLS